MSDIFDELRIYCKTVIRYGSVKPTIKVSEGKAVEAIIKRGDEEINLKPGDLSKITKKEKLDKAP